MRLKSYLNEVKLYLDDERNAPSGWKLVKTPKDIINHLKKHNVTDLSLDHDLGDDKNIGTGYDVLNWIEKEVFSNKSFKLPNILIHTANPAARKKMELALSSIKRLYNETI